MKRYFWLSMLALLVSVSMGWADVRLPKVFSDHMVLQRDMAIPVWGWADPADSVTTCRPDKKGFGEAAQRFEGPAVRVISL